MRDFSLSSSLLLLLLLDKEVKVVVFFRATYTRLVYRDGKKDDALKAPFREDHRTHVMRFKGVDDEDEDYYRVSFSEVLSLSLFASLSESVVKKKQKKLSLFFTHKNSLSLERERERERETAL